MPGLTAPFPYDVPVSPETTDRATGKKVKSPYFSQEIVDWLLEQQQRSQDSPERVATVSLTAQSASIGVTAIPSATLTAGTYRVSTFFRVTTAATTGAATSSLLVTITFTSGGITCTFSGTARTGNTTATVDSNVFYLLIDGSTPISYSTTYASNTAGQMQYLLEIALEAVSVA